MKSLANKLIIYDSNCKVCSSLRGFVLKFTSIPAAKVKAYQELDQDLVGHVDPDKFKNVMALIDTAGGRTVYGAEGVAYIFSSQYRFLDLLFRFKPIFTLFSFLYKTQAYNRYIIATPKSKFKCDCFPDKVVKYRISYIVITLLISIFLTAIFGISLRKLFTGIAASEAAMQMLLMAGTGWVLQIGLAIIMLRDRSLDYIGHLGSIMVVGLLILVPSMLFYAITGILTPYVPALSVIASSAYMLYLHIARIRYLELSQRWTVSWFLFLQSTALFWIYLFHLR
jgi:predicted DCC family thiol-disulfide oxidoreductase YuxK